MKTELSIIRKKITELMKNIDRLDNQSIQEEIDDIIELLSIIIDDD